MSRSYKKTPYSGLPKDQFFKRYANKKLRQLHRQGKDVPDGKSFRKLMNSWNICDYSNIMKFEKFVQFRTRNSLVTSELKELYCKWFKYYKGK